MTTCELLCCQASMHTESGIRVREQFHSAVVQPEKTKACRGEQPHLLGDGLAAAAAEPDPVLPAVEGRGEAGGRAGSTPGCVTPALPSAGKDNSPDCAACNPKAHRAQSSSA